MPIQVNNLQNFDKTAYFRPETGAGFPAGLLRLEYRSPADGLEDWSLVLPPANGGSTWIVCIHGHGSRGNQLYMRRDLKQYWLPAYLARGYGILTPTLRGNAWMSPQAVIDMDALLDWLRSHYGAKRFLFCSGSMGATSNLIYASLRPQNVDGIIARGAATDLPAYHAFCRVNQSSHPILQDIADSLEQSYGGTPQQRLDLYMAHSPITHAMELKDIPIFMAHGSWDKTIPVSQGRKLAGLLTESSRFAYMEIPGGDHDAPLTFALKDLIPTVNALQWIDP